jgi:RimJ/RimL family protein N-acetyltransferase
MRESPLAMPEIVTERLVLAPLGPEDAPRLFEYRSDAEVACYQTWEPASVDDAIAFIRDLAPVAFDTPGTWFQLGIRLIGSDLLVGDLGVHFLPGESREVEIGVSLAPEHQGRGYATEAVHGLLSHLFRALGKHRVTASVDPRNDKSLALLGRVGMRREAHFRKSLWFKGEWVDDLIFAILESEWRGGGGEPSTSAVEQALPADGGNVVE